jgi:hypothetical protein
MLERKLLPGYHKFFIMAGKERKLKFIGWLSAASQTHARSFARRAHLIAMHTIFQWEAPVSTWLFSEMMRKESSCCVVFIKNRTVALVLRLYVDQQIIHYITALLFLLPSSPRFEVNLDWAAPCEAMLKPYSRSNFADQRQIFSSDFLDRFCRQILSSDFVVRFCPQNVVQVGYSTVRTVSTFIESYVCKMNRWE